MPKHLPPDYQAKDGTCPRMEQPRPPPLTSFSLHRRVRPFFLKCPLEGFLLSEKTEIGLPTSHLLKDRSCAAAFHEVKGVLGVRDRPGNTFPFFSERIIFQRLLHPSFRERCMKTCRPI